MTHTYTEQEISRNVNELLQQLSLEQKAALLTGHGSWKTKALKLPADSTVSAMPYVTMSDGPHGLRKQEEEHYSDLNQSVIATCFPTGSALASGWDTENVANVAAAIAEEARDQRVSVVLGPAINIKRNPLCGRNFEYYSEDPYLAGTMAVAYVTTMEQMGVGTSLKHFACNNQETHRQTENSVVDERALHEIYLRAFEMAVTNPIAQPSTIMASYNKINGEYACANTHLLTEILRNHWHYDGTVISDWGATIDVIKCIRAGLDLEMPDSYGFHTKRLIDGFHAGEITMEDIDRAASRVLTLAYRRSTPQDTVPCDYEAHHKLARRVAAESAVLLKHNYEDPVFPLHPEERILFVGEMAVKLRFQGGGSSHISTLPCRNVVEAMQEKGFAITHADSVKLLNSNLTSYDKIVFFGGLTDSIESEGYDRSNMDFPSDQYEELLYLMEHHPCVSVVTFGGAPFTMPFYAEVQEILHMHLGGQAVGEACALLLSGQVNPSGHLAETWPLHYEDVITRESFAVPEDHVPYRESVFVGYRLYETEETPVRFEFGYGLSYTTFSYDQLTLREEGGRLRATYRVTNTGKVAGAEVSQVYVRTTEANRRNRPAIVLAGFSKDYLQPGESKEVSVLLDERCFRVYDPAEGDFVTVGGTYDILAGSSVRRLYVSASITIEGKLAEAPELTAFRDEDMTDPAPPKCRGEYTIYDSVETICKASMIGRMFLRILNTFVPLVLKGDRNDPAVKLVLCAMQEAPFDGLLGVSGGAMKPNITEFFVQHANGHPWKGLIRLLRGNPKSDRVIVDTTN